MPPPQSYPNTVDSASLSLPRSDTYTTTPPLLHPPRLPHPTSAPPAQCPKTPPPSATRSTIRSPMYSEAPMAQHHPPGTPPLSPTEEDLREARLASIHRRPSPTPPQTQPPRSPMSRADFLARVATARRNTARRRRLLHKHRARPITDFYPVRPATLPILRPPPVLGKRPAGPGSILPFSATE